MTRQTHIVDAQSLNRMLNDPRPGFRMHVIGRALVTLFERQTAEEKRANTTRVYNTVGFSGADARNGTLTAKYYLKHKQLTDWQIAMWMRPQRRSGLPRICKYWRQLDEAARARLTVACLVNDAIKLGEQYDPNRALKRAW